MPLLDIVLFIIIAYGFYMGWKQGILTSAIKLVESFLVFILAFLLKGPISLILIEHLPFISFKGLFAGITSLNIIIYEGIAFVLLTIILTIIFKLILKLTGIFNKLLNATIILGLPNKLGGAIINFVRYYIIAFLLVFILSMTPQVGEKVFQSNIASEMLNRTPILSAMTKDINSSLEEIYELAKKIDEETTEEDVNEETLKILLKYDIISEETAKSLHEQGKLDIKNFDEIIENNKKGE